MQYDNWNYRANQFTGGNCGLLRSKYSKASRYLCSYMYGVFASRRDNWKINNFSSRKSDLNAFFSFANFNHVALDALDGKTGENIRCNYLSLFFFGFGSGGLRKSQRIVYFFFAFNFDEFFYSQVCRKNRKFLEPWPRCGPLSKLRSCPLFNKHEIAGLDVWIQTWTRRTEISYESKHRGNFTNGCTNTECPRTTEQRRLL